MQNDKITIVEVVWSDSDISNSYIERLNKYLNPNNLPNITTAMWNKEILPNISKNNKYNRFMLVFDYNETKESQKCFSYSSPKPTDNKKDLRYFILPTNQKIMLNSSIDIPTKYLIKADLIKMEQREKQWQVKKNLRFNIINLNYARQFKNDISEQYNVISKNIWHNPKFKKQDVIWAHSKMIDNEKQHTFCLLELSLIQTYY